MDSIKKVRPKKLYLIADGAKEKKENLQVQKTRTAIENKINWECKVEKIYSTKNLGCAHRIKTGLDAVFTKEDKLIILEDDTLPNISFFKFCEFCLERYENDHSVYHISGCNFFPHNEVKPPSYYFSSIVNIWGWATWSRAWEKYDINMKSWQSQDKTTFLRKWCSSKIQIKDTRAMFDLHCENLDPWTWDYQWVYTCWVNNGLSLIPTQNLVQNLGIGPLGTNTKFEKQKAPYPASIAEIKFPLVIPSEIRNIEFEKKYHKNTKISIWKKIKQLYR